MKKKNTLISMSDDEIFQELFLDEFNKKNSEELNIVRSEREQKIFEMKFKKMNNIINILEKIKNMQVRVRKYTDYNKYLISENEMINFSYTISDSKVNHPNHPTPIIYIQHPLEMEITLTDLNRNPYFALNKISKHTDENLLNSRYEIDKDLISDLALFFGKNTFK